MLLSGDMVRLRRTFMSACGAVPHVLFHTIVTHGRERVIRKPDTKPIRLFTYWLISRITDDRGGIIERGISCARASTIVLGSAALVTDWSNKLAFVPVANVVEVAITHTCEDQLLVNVFHVDGGGALSAGTLSLILGEFITWVGTELYDNMPSTLSLVQVTGRDLTTQNGLIAEAAPSVPVQGAIGADNLPLNATFCVQLRTGFAGRFARGRSYVPAVPDSVASGSRVTAAWANAVVASYNALVAAMSNAGTPLVIVSRSFQGAPRAFGIITQVLNASYSDLVTDSQRRRLPGRGN